MIRDPSDGSVRENVVDDALRIAEELGQLILNQGLERMGFDPLPPVSGLPIESQKPENLARLEKSREWLKQYRRGKIPEGAENETNS